MWNPGQFQLLDFGIGRRLERFGPLLLDRPCPAAEGIEQAAPQLWVKADARFDRGAGEQGRWTLQDEAALLWTVAYSMEGDSPIFADARPVGAKGDSPIFAATTLRAVPEIGTVPGAKIGTVPRTLVFELKRTDFGHVGLFPEQAGNWDWLAAQIALLTARLGRPPKILNLFAYTGGSTLAAAAAGAEVTHVDAARNVTNWARRNAELSGLGGAAIRWIADDAMKFVGREIRRGNRYDCIVLDPPSYGHGARGEVWQLDRHLGELLAACAELTAPAPRLVLLTCHTPGYTPRRLRELLAAAFSAALPMDVDIEAAELVLPAATGRELPCGAVARWAAG